MGVFFFDNLNDKRYFCGIGIYGIIKVFFRSSLAIAQLGRKKQKMTLYFH